MPWVSITGPSTNQRGGLRGVRKRKHFLKQIPKGCSSAEACMPHWHRHSSEFMLKNNILVLLPTALHLIKADEQQRNGAGNPASSRTSLMRWKRVILNNVLTPLLSITKTKEALLVPMNSEVSSFHHGAKTWSYPPRKMWITTTNKGTNYLGFIKHFL